MSSRDLKQIEPEKTKQTEFLRSGKERVLNSTAASNTNLINYSTGMSSIRSPSEEGEESINSQESNKSLPRTSEDDYTDHETVKRVLESLRKQVLWFKDEFKNQPGFPTTLDALFCSIENEVKDFISKLLIVSDRSHFYNSTIKQANKIKGDLGKAKTDLLNEMKGLAAQENQSEKRFESVQSINRMETQEEGEETVIQNTATDEVFREYFQDINPEGLSTLFKSMMNPSPENLKEVEDFVGGIVDVIKKVEQHENQLKDLSDVQEKQEQLTQEINEI